MNLKNQPPIFVPQEHWREVEQLSKAALMDMVWDYVMQISGGAHSDAETLAEFRKRREIIAHIRHDNLRALCDELGIAISFGETAGQAIDRAIEAGATLTSQKGSEP